MSSIFVGDGLGVFDSTLTQLNGFGSSGRSRIGQGSDLASVNAATGNLVIQGQDEFLASVGPIGSLVRTYNSQGQTDGDNDDGWRLSGYRSLNLPGALAPRGNIIRTSGDSHEATFQYDTASDTWISAEGADANDVIRASGSQWQYLEGGTGIIETYDSNGRLLSVRDASSNTTTYGYTGGLLTSIQDSRGQAVFLDYTGTQLSDIRIQGLLPDATGSGQVQTLTRVRYEYSSGRLSAVTVDLTPADNSIADGNVYRTQYFYDGNSNRVSQIVQSDGSVLNITYRLVGLKMRVGTLTDGLGRVTDFRYNLLTLATTVTDPLGNETVYDYDLQNRLIEVVLPAVNGTTASIQYAYDANSNIEQVTDASGRVTRYTYNDRSDLTRSRDSLGNTVDRTYDSNDRLLTEIRYLTPAGANFTGAAPSGAQVTNYVYDTQQNLRFVVTAERRVTEYGYNAQGQLIRAITYAGAGYTAGATNFSEAALASWVQALSPAVRAQSERTDSTYDLTGQVRTVTSYASVDGTTGAGIADGNQSVRYFIYDNYGRLRVSTDPRTSSTTPGQAFVTSYAYDGLDRQISLQDGTGRITTTAYDDALNTIATTTAAGLVTTTVFSGAGDIRSVSQSAPGNLSLGTTQYDYDGAGRLLRSIDPTGQSTYYVYDERGRQTGVISPQRELTETTYNQAGQAISQVRYANLVTATLSDGSNQPIVLAISAVRPTTNVNDRTTRQYYDAAGRLVYSLDAEGFIAETQYDGKGQVSAQIQYFAPPSSAPTNGNAASVTVVSTPASDRRVRYFYDQDGNSRGSLDAAGYLTETVYNAAGEVRQTIAYATATNVSFRATGTLDQLRPALDPANDQNSYTFYDAKGQLVAQLDPQGYLTTSQYDLAGNTTGQIRYAGAVVYAGQTVAQLVTAATVVGSPNQTTTNAYDALNRVVSQTDVQGTVTTFVYDPASGFLTSSTRAFGQIDALGVSEARTTTNRYDALGRVTATLTGEGSAALAAAGADVNAQNAVINSYATRYVYDNAGRRIQSTDANGNRSYFYYDGDSRLRFTVIDAGQSRYGSATSGEVTAYVYDAFGDVLSTTQYATRIDVNGLSGGLVTSLLTGRITTNTSLDRTISSIYGDRRGLLTQTVDAAGAVSTQTYDPFAAIATRITNQGTVAAPRLRTDRYTYDARGLYTQTVEDSGGIERTTTILEYDAFGRATRTRDPNGNITSRQYDRLGRTVVTTDALSISAQTGYDAFSRVLTSTDRTGQSTTYFYDDAARTLRVTTPEGVQTVTASNRFGQSITVTRNNGTETTRYGYDRDGNLISTRDPINPAATQSFDHAGLLQTTTDARGIQTVYSYDAANRVLTRTLDPTGLNLQTRYAYSAFGDAVSVTDANGVVTETAYDKNGQVVSVTVDTVDRPNQPSALKIATAYEFDAQGRRLSVYEGIQASGSSGALIVNAALAQRVTVYTFDNEGQRTSEVVDPGSGRLNLTTTYAYDKTGNLIRRTAPNSSVTRYFYDANNRQAYSVDALGGVTESRYDAEGRVVQAIAYANVLSPANLSALSDSSTTAGLMPLIAADTANDRISRSVYDRDGRLAYTIDGVGAVTGFRYDNANRVTDATTYATALTSAQRATLPLVAAPSAVLALLATTNPDNQITHTDYFATGLVSQVTDAQNYIQRYTYDAAGNKISYTNQNNATWNYTYDAANRLSSEIAPAVNVSSVTQQTVDGIAGSYSSVVSPDGNQVYVTGSNGRTISVFTRQADGTLAPLQVVTGGQNGVTGLTGAAFLSFSADGKSLYVTGSADNTLDVFSRGTDGKLTFVQTISTGLSNPVGVAVSGDGFDVYVTSFAGNSVTIFRRNAATGALTFSQTITSATVSGLAGARSVTVSADNARVLVASATSGAVVIFVRNPSTGGLTLSQTLTTGLTGAVDVAISADGLNFYAVGLTANTVVTYRRTSTTVQFSTPSAAAGVLAPSAVKISADGSTVYVTSSTGNSVTVFNRNTSTGVLTLGSVATAQSSTGTALVGSFGLSVSADGNNVYAQGRNDNSLVSFARTGPGTLTAIQILRQGDSVQGLTTSSKRLVTRIVYDAVGNVAQRIENYDPTAPQLARVTSYLYDGLGRQRQTVTAATYVDPVSGLTYGAQTRLYDRTADDAAANVGRHDTALRSLFNTVAFDTLGNAIVAQDAGGLYSYKVYDTAGRVSYEIDADGFATRYQYDAAGNQTALTRYATALSAGHVAGAAYTAAEVVSRIAPAASDRTINTVYDALSRKTSVVQPQVYSYDATSQTSVTASPTTNFTYNAFGDVVLQSELRRIVGGVNSFDTTTRYYDQVGNQVAEIDPAGYLTQRQYTVTGQVSSSREWSEKLAAGSWSIAGYVTPTFVAAVADGPAPATLYQSAFPATTGLTATPTDALGTNFNASSGQLVVRDTQAATASLVALNGATTYTLQDATATTFAYDFSFGTGGAGVRRLIGIGNWNGSTQTASTFGFYLSITATSISTLEIDGTRPAITGGAPLGLAFNQNYRLEFVTDSRGATLYLYAAGGTRGAGYQYRFDSTATQPTAIRTQIFASRTTAAVSEGSLSISSIKVTNGTESTLSASTLAARRTSNVRETVYGYDRLDQQTSATRTGVINTKVEADGRVSASVGSQTTLTRYDGVGNVIATTDAAQYALDPTTPSTLSFYDALGRQVASTVTQDATTARLTTTSYDVYGNAVAQTQYVNGTTRRTAQTTLADLPTARQRDLLNDASTYSIVDVLGRVTTAINAVGTRTELSYDAYGKVAKTENAFARLDGSTGRRIQILTYNGRGLQTEEASRLESGNLARRTTFYNAFGEVTDRGLAGGDQSDATAGLVGTFERYRYDNNGRLVYDNRDGSNTVYLSDLKGNVTAQIKSPTTDLGSYFTAANTTNSPSVVAGLSTGIRRSESVFDELGRVTEQRDVAFSESTFQLDTPITSSYSGGVNTLSIPNTLPLGATPTLRIAPVGTSNWINVPLQLPVTNGGFGPWSGAVTGNPPAGVYRYELAYVIAGQSMPIAAGSGQVQLSGPLTNTAAITVTTQTVSGAPFYVFQSNNAGVSLAGMTSIKLFTNIIGGAPSGTPTPKNAISAAEYAVVNLGSGRYGVPVPDGAQLYALQPVGTAVSDVYSVNFFSAAPSTASTAVALVSALFQGKIPIASIPANLRVASFEQKPAGSGPDQSYITPPPGKINATTDGPSSLAYLTANGYATNYDFRVRFTDAAGNPVNLSTLMVNGQPVGDAQGFVRGTFGSVAQPIDATASNLQTVTYTPTTSRTLDRWGNVLSQTLKSDVKITDAQGNTLSQTVTPTVFSTTNYRYDEFDRTIQQRLATTSAVTNRGVQYTVTPTSETAFDAVGRVIAQTDANFNLSRQSYDLAGDVLSQTDGSGSTTRYGYDQLGRQISRTSPLNQVVSYRYDSLGQLISEQDTVRSAATTYAYDALGNRVNDNNQIAYLYDGYGNVLVRSLNAYTPAGGTLQQQRSTYVYDALGRQTRQTDANGNFTTTTYDAYGRRVSETVLSNGATAGNAIQYRYNLANDKTDDIYTVGGLNRVRSYTYYANGLLKSSFETDAAFFTSQAPQRSDYAYDAAGRVTHARTQQSGVAGLITLLASGVPQDSIYTYDEAGRLSRVTDPSATVSYGYDAAGNRKLVTSRIPNLQKTNPIEHRYRYDYDGANRVQTVLEADVIFDTSGNATGLKNATGQTFQFDANGNRVFQQDFTQGTSTQSIAAGSGEAGIYDALTAFATPARAGQTLINSFDARNRLTEVRTGTGGSTGPVTSRRTYDNSNSLDQVLDYTTFNSSGAQLARQRNLYYADGTLREVQNYNGSDAYTGANQYSYDKAGNLTRTRLVNSSNALVGTYDYSYVNGRRGYQQSLIAATTPGNSTPNNTSFTYNAWDELVSSGTSTGTGLTTITARYFNDNAGRVLQKIAGAISPTAAFDFFLYQGDNALGSAEIIDYSTSGTSTSHFGFNFTPISGQYPAITPGTYVVQAGDSLPGIAQAIYGDASFWYLIADANPTFQNSTLTVGTVLQLPNTVIASKNNSTTFKPFSAQDLIGDVTPPLPPPPTAKSNVFASLIIVAVAVAASVATYGALAPQAGALATASIGQAVVAGAAAGAASSAASQVAGIALGVQNNFSFGAVASGALVGGLSAGLTQAIGVSAGGTVKIDGKDVASYFKLTGQSAQAAQAAVSATVSQSVNIALGYQNNFSFAAVAASAVAAGLVTSPEGQGSNGRENPGTGQNSVARSVDDFTRNFARNGIRNSVQIALEGGGKINIANIAGDAFGNALGNALVREINREPTQASAPEPLSESEAFQYRQYLNSSDPGVPGSLLTPDEIAFQDTFQPQAGDSGTELPASAGANPGVTSGSAQAAISESTAGTRALRSSGGTKPEGYYLSSAFLADSARDFAAQTNRINSALAEVREQGARELADLTTENRQGLFADAIFGTAAGSQQAATQVPFSSISDAVYLSGPVPVARLNLGSASLIANGTLNIVNSAVNSALNAVGAVGSLLEPYQGEIITAEVNFGNGFGQLPALGQVGRAAGYGLATVTNGLFGASRLIRGLTLESRTGLNSLEAALPGVRFENARPVGGGSFFDSPDIFSRGLSIDEALGRNNLGATFKTFDNFDSETGLALSGKSIDLTLPSKTNISRLLSSSRRDIRTASLFNQRFELNGIVLAPDMIQARQLEFVIQSGRVNADQLRAFQSLSEYGSNLRPAVGVNFVVIP